MTREFSAHVRRFLLLAVLAFCAAAQPAQQRRPPSDEEQLRQAEAQLLRIANEHRQARSATSWKWGWVAGGFTVIGLSAGTVVAVRRLRAGQ